MARLEVIYTTHDDEVAGEMILEWSGRHADPVRFIVDLDGQPRLEKEISIVHVDCEFDSHDSVDCFIVFDQFLEGLLRDRMRVLGVDTTGRIRPLERRSHRRRR